MRSQDVDKLNLPDSPGVYFFIKKRKTEPEILYVGKATSVKDRVKSYFSSDLFATRGPLILKMVQEAQSVIFESTDSVLEALILEAKYIKKFQPDYNSLAKDDKSFNYVVVTNERWPKILIEREKNLRFIKRDNNEPKFVAGPFPHGLQLREALKIIRKIFPYRDSKCVPKEVQLAKKGPNANAEPCFNRQIGLCPGVCTGEVSESDYRKTIKNIILFFDGKKKEVLRNLEREMRAKAKVRDFEMAQKIKNQIFAINHINDVALIRRSDALSVKGISRVEAFDIAHLSGQSTVGVMVAIEGGEIKKSEYRKFKIRGSKGKVAINDIDNLKELLERRLIHGEWGMPNVIVVDGGKAQFNLAKKIINSKGLDIEVVAVVKDERHKPKEILGEESTVKKYEKEILLANSEAHRFGIKYYRNLSGRKFRGLK